jgi:hypothetical protein
MKVTWEHQPWAEAYRLVMLEADRNTRLVRIRAATSAIEARIKEPADSPAGRYELTAMDNALVILHVWEKEVA